jgi:deoxyribodipyrimidine photo-lyase
LASGAASRWWLHHSLISLENAYRELGLELRVLRGDSLEVLCRVASEVRASAVHIHRRYHPAYDARDAQVAESLVRLGLDFRCFPSYLLHDPATLRTGSGSPYRVFTPFWKKFLSAVQPTPPVGIPGPLRNATPRVRPPDAYHSILELDLLPAKRWDTGFYELWNPGTQGAIRRMNGFRSAAIHHYPTDRDRPDLLGTSMLSPHIHFGEVSASQLWHLVQNNARGRGLSDGEQCYLRELGWREFSWHVLIHHPDSIQHPLRDEYRSFPWSPDATLLRAWQRGQTGYPIVDAGLRQLWNTGWMHNRVRMVVSSFLTKHLLQSWQDGAGWFWNTLVDADLANNTMGWQWAAGCGADAQPYFRIFNPITQGQKFDPDGIYVREWVPELRDVPTKYLHAPWEAPVATLEQAGVVLGQTYPRPIVDHKDGRARALAALEQFRTSTQTDG